MPQDLKIDDSKISIQFGVPLMHATGHEKKCRDENALKLQEGVGTTDGEANERVWSQINKIATATKEMGPGNRNDTFDNYLDSYNWQKNMGLGGCLVRYYQMMVH